MDKHRSFIAVRIHANDLIKDTMEVFRKKLSGEAIKWVPPALMHLTLAFLGDTPTRLIPKIVERMYHIAGSFSPFALEISGVGVFPGCNKPRVLWMGIKDPQENLVKIQEQLRQQVADLGFEQDRRPFNPHLTLGRIKYLRDLEVLKDLLDQYRNADFHEEHISELIFYESITRPAGPEYLPLARCALGREQEVRSKK